MQDRPTTSATVRPSYEGLSALDGQTAVLIPASQILFLSPPLHTATVSASDMAATAASNGPRTDDGGNIAAQRSGSSIRKEPQPHGIGWRSLRPDIGPPDIKKLSGSSGKADSVHVRLSLDFSIAC
jgi:hypothetical protein